VSAAFVEIELVHEVPCGPGKLLQEVYSIKLFREWPAIPVNWCLLSVIHTNDSSHEAFKSMKESAVLGSRCQERRPMRKKSLGLTVCVMLPLAYAANGVTGATALMDDLAKPKAGNQPKTSPSVLSSKVFTLKAADLMVVEEKIHGLLDSPEVMTTLGGVAQTASMPGGEGIVRTDANVNAGGAPGSGLGALGGLGGMFGLMGGGVPIGAGALGQPNAGGALGIGGGISGVGGLGALGFAGGPVVALAGRPMQASAAPSWRMVTDERTHSVIFRGTANDLQTVAEIVALAELKSDQPLPALQRLGAFRLQHANAADLVEKLAQLEISVRLCAFDDSNIIATLGSEAARKEIGDLIKALDIEVTEK
jgi:hypothetical protein